MKRLLYDTKFWLFVIYPSAAAISGIATALFIAWRFPDEPHPALYGGLTAIVAAVFWYGQTWLHRRKRRQAEGS